MTIRKTIIGLKHRLFKKSHSLSIGKSFILICAIALSTISCEDVIEVDLNSVEPRIVIEGLVTDQMEPFTVIISKTGDYFNPSVFPKVSGAVVIISDTNGGSDTLHEVESGLYQSDTLRGVPLRTYTLTVEVEGNTYTASSTMPIPIRIDSLAYGYEEGGGFKDKGFVLHCFFTDRNGTDDYCRIIVERNGEVQEDYYLYDGQWSDGSQIDFNPGGFELKDSLIVKLLCLDEPVFDYFLTLSGVVATDEIQESAWSPANPNSNLSNNALGYFAALTVRVDTVIIKE